MHGGCEEWSVCYIGCSTGKMAWMWQVLADFKKWKPCNYGGQHGYRLWGFQVIHFIFLCCLVTCMCLSTNSINSHYYYFKIKNKKENWEKWKEREKIGVWNMKMNSNDVSFLNHMSASRHLFFFSFWKGIWASDTYLTHSWGPYPPLKSFFSHKTFFFHMCPLKVFMTKC